MSTFRPARFEPAHPATPAAAPTPFATPAAAAPSWSTASAGAATHTTPGELDALGDHLGLCRNLRGPMFLAHCFQQASHRFVAAHSVTTSVALALLAAGLWWLV